MVRCHLRSKFGQHLVSSAVEILADEDCIRRHLFCENYSTSPSGQAVSSTDIDKEQGVDELVDRHNEATQHHNLDYLSDDHAADEISYDDFQLTSFS
jgi:hypothetical protein